MILICKAHSSLSGWPVKPARLSLTYYGPYQDKHCYWTGLLLLRVTLYVIFAFNILGEHSINLILLCITTASLGITIVTRVTSQIYKKLRLDVLEASFIFNLGILAVATYHVSLNLPGGAREL